MTNSKRGRCTINCALSLTTLTTMLIAVLCVVMAPAEAAQQRTPLGVRQAVPEDAAAIQTMLAARLLDLGYSVTVKVYPLNKNEYGIFLSGNINNNQKTEMLSSIARLSTGWKTQIFTDRLNIAVPPPAPAVMLETVKVPLFFTRHADAIKKMLDDISASGAAAGDNVVDPLKGLVTETTDENVLELHGTKAQVDAGRRLIAAIDLPVPSVQMDMWGIQVSGNDPQRMQKAVGKVRHDIDQARSAVRDLYQQLQAQALISLTPGPSARASTPEAAFSHLLTNSPSDTPPGLGYTEALKADRAFSISDILLRLIAGSPTDVQSFANGITQRLGYDQAGDTKSPPAFRGRYNDILSPQHITLPFSHLFAARGLLPINDRWTLDGNGTLESYNRIARISVLQFTFNYAQMVEQPDTFSPYGLQQASDTLTGRIQLAVDAINQDIYELIIEPTLDKIGRDLADTEGIEYAQLGRVRVASVSGVETSVTGTSVSPFDSTPPLRLSDLLHNASAVPTTGVPSSQVISALAAADQDRTVTSEISQGVSLDVTPNVLRNASSAELNIHLTIGDPQAGTRDAGVPPLSRVSQHEVQDTVYLNALDIVDLSTFSSQATLSGGRAYAPLIGPLWHGVFGDVPVVGDLFSWKKNPKTVYHQSILFASTIITPTAMQLALLYPIDSGQANINTAENTWHDPKTVAHLRNLVNGY